MDMATTAFFSGQYEGIWLVLEALFELENNESGEISRGWVVRKLSDLMLNDFIDGIVNTYLPSKEEKQNYEKT